MPIESGEGKVGMKVVTEDGPGVIEKLIGQDNAIVKLDTGFMHKGDLSSMKEQTKKEEKSEETEPKEKTKTKTKKK